MQLSAFYRDSLYRPLKSLTMDSRLVLTVLASVLFLATSATAQKPLVFDSERPVKQDPVDTKVWLFAVDGLKRPYSFVDKRGSLKGFDVDLIQQVCAIANKKCKMVLSAFTECTFTTDREMTYPGRGLMSGWFDACPGYAITEDRMPSFDFTKPYLTTVATFTVAPGNPSNFNPSDQDYSAFTLCHLTGAYTNAACLTRQTKVFGKILIAKDLPDAKQLLLNGTCQVLFSPRTRIDGLDVLGPRLDCSLGGAGIMVKRGSPLPAWWDAAFQTLYSSGAYAQLCQDDAIKFNYAIKCLATPPSPSHNRQ